uniref:Uncharacterized protein n=1 Tax=Rhizophora mucronata TaxID=61149 RepID=A0A2P2JG23_RHIMU
MLLKALPGLNEALESFLLLYCALGLRAAAAIPLFWFDVFRIKSWLSGTIHAGSRKKTSEIFLQHKRKVSDLSHI